ncbi:MAG: acyltransferase domain-containing protein, partial [Thermodesulfobacteriota bacterium]
LNEQMEGFLQSERLRGVSYGQKYSIRQPKLVFVFSPTGSQWLGMGLELFNNEPIFRKKIEQCDQLFRKLANWSLIEELKANEGNSSLNEVDVMQPVLFAIQVALYALWNSWGIKPDAVIGHSMGEIASAHVAGILSLEDAARIICRRSQLVRLKVAGQGAMAVIELKAEDVKEILSRDFPQVSIAACNGPTTTVVSGDPETLKNLQTSLDTQGIFCQMVKVDYASHSPQMELLRSELIEALDGIKANPSTIPMYSTVTATRIDGSECDKYYWMKNLRETVLFYQAIDELISDGHNIFLEISPHPILSVSISQSLNKRDKKGLVLPSLRREEEELGTMLSSFSSLYVHGYTVDWNKLYPLGGECVRLPFYPFQRERYWIHDGGIKLAHPLLGQRMSSPAHSETHFWETKLGTNLIPYLDDHRVQGAAVFPATAYIEMAMSAAVEVYGEGAHTLKDISFQKALFLPDKGKQIVQIILSPTLPGEVSFQLYSLQEGNGKERQTWNIHASGSISLNHIEKTPSAPNHEPPEKIRDRCREIMTKELHYSSMNSCGINYGPSFQGVEQIFGRRGEAIGLVHLPENAWAKANVYQIHPALLDASFQVIIGTYPRDSKPALYMPVGLHSLRIFQRPSPERSYWSHAILRRGQDLDDKFIEGDIHLLDENGTVMVQAMGLRAQRLDTEIKLADSDNLDDWFYEIQWQLTPTKEVKNPSINIAPSSQGKWLILADKRGV